MNTKKKVAIIVFLIIACISTICFATSTRAISENNEVEDPQAHSLDTTNISDENVKNIENSADTENVTKTEEKEQAESENIEEKKVIKENVYVGTTDAKYTLNDNIYGNVFLAGNEIIINSDFISGDIFAAANNITINENTVIDGNVYFIGQTINIKGTVYRTAYIIGKVITLEENSLISYDTLLAGDIVECNGELSRNVAIFAGKLTINETANILGNLTYEANEKSEIPEGVVKGKVDFKQIVVDEKSTSEIIFEYAIDLLQSLIFTLCVFIIISLMSRKFVYKSQELIGKHVLKSLGLGLFGLISIPIIIVVLLLISATSVVGIALIPTYILLILIANSVTAIALSGMICARSNGMKLPIVVTLITIALWALESLPYIGTLVVFFSTLIGFGILLQGIFTGNKTISKGQVDSSNNK